MTLTLKTTGLNFWWTATAFIPDGEETIKHTFKINFAYDQEIQKNWKDVLANIDGDDFDAGKHWATVIVNWDDINMDDKPLDYNKENLEQLMDLPYIAKAITTAWFDAMSAGKVQAKKLTDAVLFVLNATATHGDKSQVDADAFGIIIETAPIEYQLWDINADAFQLFMGLMTQWRTGFSGVTGLDYTAIAPTADLLGIKLDTQMFSFIQSCETEVLGLWNNNG